MLLFNSARPSVPVVRFQGTQHSRLGRSITSETIPTIRPGHISASSDERNSFLLFVPTNLGPCGVTVHAARNMRSYSSHACCWQLVGMRPVVVSGGV